MSYPRRNSRSEPEEPKSGPHRDYTENLKVSRVFVEKIKNQMPLGMNTKITGSDGIPESLVIISWQPDRYAPRGNYATPIFMHQDKRDFSKKLETIFNVYLKVVKDFNDKKQLSLFDKPEVKDVPRRNVSPMFKTLDTMLTGNGESPDFFESMEGPSVFDSEIPKEPSLQGTAQTEFLEPEW